MTTAHIVGLALASALFGYLLGLWVRARVPQATCSCHTPIAWALRRYLSIFSVLLLMSGCAGRDFCRDAKGRFERCPSKRVMDILDAGYPSHLEPMGADYNGKDFWCVDRKGDRWLSRGECD